MLLRTLQYAHLIVLGILDATALLLQAPCTWRDMASLTEPTTLTFDVIGTLIGLYCAFRRIVLQ